MITTILGLWLGSMFVYAAGMKLARYNVAGGLLLPYSALPTWIARPGGYLLPWLELAAGLVLLADVHLAGGLLAVGLGSAFAYSSFQVLRRGAPTPCGCSGGSDRVTRTTFARACLITAAGTLVALGTGSEVSTIGSLIIAAIALAPGALTLQARLRSRQIHASHVLKRGTNLAGVRAGGVPHAGKMATAPANEHLALHS